MMYLIVLIGLVPFTCGTTLPDNLNGTSTDFVDRLRTVITKLWDTADVNHDGNWNKTDMESLFTIYDANHNNKITQDEFTTVWNKNVPLLHVVGRGLFYDFDTNHDHFITDDDLDAYVHRIDADNNGTVEKEEFVDYFTRLFDILYKIATIQVPTGK